MFQDMFSIVYLSNYGDLLASIVFMLVNLDVYFLSFRTTPTL
jgi:hypothetical protein